MALMRVNRDMTDAGDNYAVLQECVSSAILEQYSTEAQQKKRPKRRRKRTRDDPSHIDSTAQQEYDAGKDSAELAESIEYLSREIFTSLPSSLRTLSYSTLQSNAHLWALYALPLATRTLTSLLDPLPASITDTLTSTCMIAPHTDSLAAFLSPILHSYLGALVTPPPAPHSTRPASNACELCARDWIPLTYHHLVPRSVHAKALKRGWHKDWEVDKVAWLCRACHSFIHRMVGNEELARQWHEMEWIREREDVRRWVGWVGGVRWAKR